MKKFLILSLFALLSIKVDAMTINNCQSEQCITLFNQYKAAASRGHPEAISTLGQFYQQGFGTSPDLEKGLRYLKKASKAGSISASYKAGLLLLQETELRDIDKGIHFLTKAARKGYQNADFLLGIAYLSDSFGIQNLSKADTYLQKAYLNKHQDMPAVIDLINAKQSLSLTQLPLLSAQISLSPLVLSSDGHLAWPENHIETITITAQPLEVFLTENLIAYRGKETSLGSRLPTTRCTKRPGCYLTNSVDSLLSDFPFVLGY
ncbi:hypothetical protein tloyanaT_03600 [Thalassotalea loyana]|uniref:Sel1 repeat family protein n=1 Tax=Thalassotalea loyana TaxID=280483 RepID=A0ABQ6H7J4_9GAMM|nr:tetratricopeptide repeat protein [Thalassotalea loyana]GLX84108.1 hypothetical protein tloyanaT_03600 [Thalassotalea loyana]